MISFVADLGLCPFIRLVNMNKNNITSTFSACVLSSEFSISEINLHPGQSFPHSSQSPLLAGGFSAVFPETNFPLSPALQVNNDLTTMSEQVLESFAQAELAKITKASFKNYMVDPNLHVCVLGDDGEELERFLDTYGGVLEIDPLLLKGSHENHAQITEIAISEEKDGYKIIATERVPVDMDACTYCGQCAQVCPESCIDPELRVDFSSCTFCRACEPVCEPKAMDIYSVSRRTINTPAIITLGQVKLDLPEDTAAVYDETNLAQYFTTLFSTQVEEVVTCDNSICHFSVKSKKGCTLCKTSCQYGAISQGAKGVEVDYQLCNECGECVANCPTGAMQYQRFNDSTFVEFFRLFKMTPGQTVVIGDEDSLHTLWWQQRGQEKNDLIFLEYTEPNAISLFHILFLLGQGAGRVVVLTDKGELSGMAQINKTVEALTDNADFVQCCSIAGLKDMLAQETTSPITTPVANYNFLNRRKKIAELLETLYLQKGAEVALTMAEHGPFATVSCDESKCTQCFACLNECKVQALKAGAGAMSLTLNASLCFGCGACVAVCPEKALTVKGEAMVGTAFFEDNLLAKAEPMLCKGCGKEFGTKKSFEKVMAILASKNMTEKGHFEYCEECRVIKMFESA